jgi:Rieske Fe-S protein
MGCQDCLNRREFLARTAAGAAALVAIEGCGDGQIGPSAPAALGNFSVTVNLADYPALATVGTLVRIDGQAIGVVRTGASSFVASSTICTHEGCDTNVRGNQYSCPCHDSLFSATGAVLRGPADRPLDRLFVIQVAGTNTIQITTTPPPGATIA